MRPVTSLHPAAAEHPAPAASFAAIDWQKPWFAPFAPRGARWQRAALAGEQNWLQVLNADAQQSGQSTGRGLPLTFVAQHMLAPGSAYEAHIAATGCVPTRHNLHDFFNALVWFRFPQIKAVLNARQAHAIETQGIGPTRGSKRDALTLFDENALLFVSSDPALSAALREFDWSRLFTTERPAWGQRCEAHSFGHALLEKLVTPYKACTAHTWIVEAPAVYFSWPLGQRDAWLDSTVSAGLAALPTLTSRMFAPLPVLGIPGWWADNQCPSFYADVAVFRPGRRNGGR
ncbi:DUF3025 domain-containing protein [Paraburkholderia bonniea]|uniref:DUF3025 domain-containing protein n=1 Tax=Paraburkholderia bonniea TaxID=2152891 RepID=UPI00257468BD|nr:DUF3025 domain-containing protein [Paraburkholderia bonniea]WJF89846.1 DUF3025 domain-containing protein [Paraburkholderia bonniea]WJF93160.1 DUF3025 domain-containing protein [Paraburkholderia bonniea]